MRLLRVGATPDRSKGEEAWGEKAEGYYYKGKIRFWYILIPIVRKGNILIPKGQKERKSVTFAIRFTYDNIVIWYYDREGVKFRDSGSEIERNIAKRQISALYRSVA